MVDQKVAKNRKIRVNATVYQSLNVLFRTLSIWGRHAISGGITQNVHKTDKKCKWNVEKLLVKSLILRGMLKMRILSLKYKKKNIYLYILYIYI